MATAGMSYEELEIRKKLLLDQLQETQNNLLQKNEVAGAMDIHHPERSQGWKPYRHQEYPKTLYHPVKLDPTVEARRLQTRRRNEANPNLAPLELEHSRPLTLKVLNKAEEEKALEGGFVKLPPQLKAEAEPVVSDPLADSMGAAPAKGKRQ